MTSFRLAEFVPQRWRGQRELTVFAPDGTRLRAVRPAAGDTVFAALTRQGLQLPSNCGGGQSCGLCEVRVRDQAPKPTSPDKAQLRAGKFKEGRRLACNMKFDADLAIEVSGGADLWAEHERVRPKMMTVVAIMADLLPIMCGSGTGSEVMSRIAAPMVGGMISSTVLTLCVIPALYALVKQWQLRRELHKASMQTVEVVVPVTSAQ